MHINQAAERSLALTLQRFSEVVDQMIDSTMPHELCTYLYDLSGKFATFYEACPILKPDIAPEVRESRLALSALTSKTLEAGLSLLGIQNLQRM
jgi:arginyl-tRNA synthetase